MATLVRREGGPVSAFPAAFLRNTPRTTVPIHAMLRGDMFLCLFHASLPTTVKVELRPIRIRTMALSETLAREWAQAELSPRHSRGRDTLPLSWMPTKPGRQLDSA